MSSIRIRRLFDRTRSFVHGLVTGYEPVVVAQLVAAFFTLLAGLGITVGDWPQKVDAVLVFVNLVVLMAAGAIARSKVSPVHEIRDSHSA